MSRKFDLEKEASEQPLTKFINLIFYQAFKMGADQVILSLKDGPTDLKSDDQRFHIILLINDVQDQLPPAPSVMFPAVVNLLCRMAKISYPPSSQVEGKIYLTIAEKDVTVTVKSSDLEKQVVITLSKT